MSALPPNPSLTHLKNQAKALRKGLKAGEPQAFKRLREALPHYLDQPDDALRRLSLVDAQLVVAREYGFDGWVRLREAIRTTDLEPSERAAHMLEAVSQNDAEMVKALLAQDASLANSKGPFPSYSSFGEFSMLHIAAVKVNAEIVGILLDHGADIDARVDADAEGEVNWTALTYAIQRARRGQSQTADLLIERGAEVNIDAAVMLDDLQRVTALLDKDADLVNYLGAGNNLPINLVRSNEMARLLFDRGAKASTVKMGRFAGDKARAAFFIENGATVDLQSAIEMDDVDRLKTLLATGQDAEIIRTSLLTAKSVEVARLLLEHGADPNAKADNLHGSTPLGNAIGLPGATHRRDLADFLIEHGAEVDIVTAAALDDVEQVRGFLERDASLANARSFEGYTALHATRSAEIARLLLQHGADTNAKIIWCNGGYTVLQVKLWQRDLSLIEILLDAGADPQNKDTMRGWTATEWAERWHQWEEARQLLASRENSA